MTGTEQPLSGIRVVDLSGPIGAYASHLLTGLGADVLLVEPLGGDALRHSLPRRHGLGLGFAYYHGGQRSLLLDTTREAAVPTLADLARDADALLVSPSPHRPLAGYDETTTSLSWTPTDAVVCAITPFGLTGPLRRWRSSPFVSHAMSGDMYRVGPPEGPPVAAPARICWDEAGAHAVVCVLAALLARAEVGGQLIDLSVHDVLCAKDFQIETYSVTGKAVGGRNVGVGYPPTGTWRCADGQIDIGAHQRTHWDAFLEMLGDPDELQAPALADVMVRREIFDGLSDTIATLVAAERREDLVQRGQAAGLPCAVRNTPSEFVRDAQLTARRFFATVDDPELGPLRLPGAPVVSSVAMFRPGGPAPGPGAGGDEWARGARVDPAEIARPLHGVRVLSFGAFIAGNTTGLALAELGADVVKIEPFERPEVLRTAGYAYGRLVKEPSGVTNTVLYAGLTRGVRSLSLDMHTDLGRDLFRRLAGAADVVIENFGSAGQLAAWGCASDDLLAINPELVMLSLSGYGRTGPRASYRAYGTNVSAFTGLSEVWGHTHGTLTDYVCSVHGVVGVLAGLAFVARHGHGVLLDAAQIETMAAVMAPLLVEPLVNGRDVVPPGNDVPGTMLSGAFRCAGDDRWVAIEIDDLADWRALCAVLERADLVAHDSEEVARLRPQLELALGEWAAVRSPHTAAMLLQGRGIAAGAVQDSEDVARDPALRSRGMVVELNQPDLGPIEYAQSPYHLSKTPGLVRRCGPRLGEHTAELLHEWLGLDDAEIRALAGHGAVFVADRS